MRTFVFTSVLLSNLFFLPSCQRVGETPAPNISPTPAIANSNSPTLDERLTNSYLNRTPVTTVPNLTRKRAISVRDRFVASLVPSLGQVVGYKAALTSKTAQSRFNVSHPVQGVLLEGMLRQSPAAVPANFGARSLFEGDLMVRVGSEAINTAATPREALAALDAVIPSIELPDLVYAPNLKLDAPAIVAINAGARLGVLGESIPLAATAEWEERLGKVELVILDEAGNRLAEGKSNALLGHPLKVVLWLRDALQEQDKSLKKGDLLSLGTITPPMPVKSGSTVRARYIGLDPSGAIEISVRFD